MKKLNKNSKPEKHVKTLCKFVTALLIPYRKLLIITTPPENSNKKVRKKQGRNSLPYSESSEHEHFDIDIDVHFAVEKTVNDIDEHF